MAEFDLRISGGRVLLPGVGLTEVDVLVKDGRVSALCEREAAAAADEVLPVPGLVVLPGAIDAHVHLGQDITVPRTPEDVSLETTAAAAGGVTTLLAYLMTAQPYTDVFSNAVALLEANSAIDFGFHFCIVTREQLAQLLRERSANPGISITIGNEHADPRLGNLTIVTAEYRAGPLTGVIGVIGPTRMPYEKVISIVGHTSRLVSDLLG